MVFIIIFCMLIDQKLLHFFKILALQEFFNYFYLVSQSFEKFMMSSKIVYFHNRNILIMGNSQGLCQQCDTHTQTLSNNIEHVKTSEAVNTIIYDHLENTSDMEQFDNPSRAILANKFLQTPVIQVSSKLKESAKMIKFCTLDQLNLSQTKRRNPTNTKPFNLSEKSILVQTLSDYIIQTAKQIPEALKIDIQTFVKTKNEPITKYYDLIKKIGQGSYGTVHIAKNKTTQQLRAVKILKKKTNQQSHTSYLTQMQMLRSLDHPNIVKIFEVFHYNNFYYVVMELCEGGSVAQFFNMVKTYSEQYVKAIMNQLFSAVSYLHGLKIVHRDLKLDNIVLVNKIDQNTKVQNLNIKIIDFGGAIKIKSCKNTLKKMVGTAAYLAPEIIDGYFNEKCDLWSCGVILHILLTKKHPFKSYNREKTLQNVQKRQFDFEKGNLYQNLSECSKNLLGRLLQRAPHKRISADKALNHQWFNEFRSTCLDLKSSNRIMSSLSNYYRPNNFVAIVETYLAFHKVNQKQRSEIGILFKQLDKKGNGNVSRQQLIELYKNNSQDPIDQDQINYILNKIDKNQSGYINFTQFLSACYSRKKLFLKKSLREVFDEFDENSDGFIDVRQLNILMRGCKNKQIKNIFQEVDCNQDQKISKDEFVSYLEKFAQ